MVLLGGMRGDMTDVVLNLRIGRVGQLLAPGWGYCLRCKTPWRFVRWHDTQYGTQGHGCLPLCEKCWAELTPTQRVPFYRELIESWHEAPGRESAFDEEWAEVEAAVLSGR